MKKYLLFAVVGLALLLAPLSAEKQFNGETYFYSEVYIPCALGGLGETIVLEGYLHTLITYTINDNNVSGKWHYQPQGLTAYGQTSGLKYQATGVTQESFKGSLQNGQYCDSFVNNFRMVGQGPGNNYLVHETMHITINADGEVKVTHDNFMVECK